MAKKTTKRLYGMATVALVTAGAAWVWRRSNMGLLPTVWRRVFAIQYGNARAQELIDRVERRYGELLAERTLPENRELRAHATQNILPGLALYQVLLQESENDRQATLAEVDAIFRQWTLSKNRSLAAFKVVPLPFGLFKFALDAKIKIFPAEGWDFKFVENSADRVAFNGTRCFYLKTLTDYDAPELTATFCKADEVMAELFARSVQFIRPHTLGRGDAMCDFQYHRVR